jgi:hypothetical protein
VEEPATSPAEGTNGTEERAVISQDTVVHPGPPGAGGDAEGPGPPDRVEPPEGDTDLPAEEGADGGDAQEPGADSDEPAAVTGEEASEDPEVEVAAEPDAEVAEEPEGEVPTDDSEPEEGAPDDLPDPESFHEGADTAEPGAAPQASETPPAPPRRPTIPIGGTTRAQAHEPRKPILPPYAESRPGGGTADAPREGLFSSRRRGLLVLGGTVLGIAVLAFGIQQFTSEDDGGSTPQNASDSAEGTASKPARKKAAIDPSKVTVAVLNGTTVPGLARQIGDTIEQEGFQLGTVTNFIDQQRAESVVLYAPGAEREAADVGRRLKITQREAIDAESQGQAGDATVVVVAGADKTQ